MTPPNVLVCLDTPGMGQLMSIDEVLTTVCRQELGGAYLGCRYRPGDGLWMLYQTPDGHHQERRIYEMQRNRDKWSVWLYDREAADPRPAVMPLNPADMVTV